MSRKSTAPVQILSPCEARKTLRDGQAKLDKLLQTTQDRQKNLQWPGGYGKSMGIACSLKWLYARGICNRSLIVTANDTQRNQMINDFESDCKDVGVALHRLPHKITKDAAEIALNEQGLTGVFVTTIQSIAASTRSTGVNFFHSMLNSAGKWFIAADEYHHYGMDMDWGESLKELIGNDNVRFVLATSATPDRNGSPTIFGPADPDVSVSYASAAEDKCVKNMTRVRYEYAIDALDNGTVPVSYTATELRERAGDAGGIDQFEHKRKLRYSTKYVRPLIMGPLARLHERRMLPGCDRMQLLVRAFSCDYAKNVCDQIRKLNSLSCDWMGTGPNGRSDYENNKVRDAFCPRKGSDGSRKPSLDVLVQVGMAGEGFDSVNVGEIIDLSLTTLDGAATSSRQFYLRGAREYGDLELMINVGHDHPLSAIEDVNGWIDSGQEPSDYEDVDIQKPRKPYEPTFPEFQETVIEKADLTSIDMDEPLNKRIIREVEERKNVSIDITSDEAVDIVRAVLTEYENHPSQEEDRERMRLSDARTQLDKAIGALAWRAARQHSSSTDSSLIGDFKKRINGKLLGRYGKRSSMLVENIIDAYDYIGIVLASVKDGEVPLWLK